MDTVTGHPPSHEPEWPERTMEPQQAPADEPHGHPTAKLEPAEPLRLDSDRDLSRIGFWSLGLGGMGVLIAITFMLAGGILPGTLVMGVALICAFVGALVLALVAHHQG